MTLAWSCLRAGRYGSNEFELGGIWNARGKQGSNAQLGYKNRSIAVKCGLIRTIRKPNRTNIQIVLVFSPNADTAIRYRPLQHHPSRREKQKQPPKWVKLRQSPSRPMPPSRTVSPLPHRPSSPHCRTLGMSSALQPLYRTALTVSE